MAATIILSDLPTGQTLTVDVYPDDSDTAAASGISLAEATNRKTVYSYSNASLTGLHRLLVKLSGTVIGSRWAPLATTGTVEAADSRQAADPFLTDIFSQSYTSSQAGLYIKNTNAYVGDLMMGQISFETTIDDVAATTTSFTVASLGGRSDNALKDQLLVMLSGNLMSEAKPILSHVGTLVTVSEPFTAAPANGDQVQIQITHIHPVSDIQEGLAREGADGDTLETLSDQLDDKTGYKLAADGLDAIDPDVPDDEGTTFAQRLMRLFGRFYRKVTKTEDSIISHGEDGATVAVTQPYTSDGDSEEVGSPT